MRLAKAAAAEKAPPIGPPRRAPSPGRQQLLPTEGFPVSPGAAYTLRVGVADAGDPNVDTALLLRPGSLVLTAPPKAAARGPYAAVRRGPGGGEELGGAAPRRVASVARGNAYNGFWAPEFCKKLR